MWLRQEPSENGSLEGDVCSHLSRLLLDDAQQLHNCSQKYSGEIH